jgi:hypothetical protein
MEGQGHVMRVPVIEQDNMSTISIVITAGGRYRTKHLRVRIYMAKQYCDDGLVEIEYTPTGNLVSDGMTKPLQGTLLYFMRAKLHYSRNLRRVANTGVR